MDRDKRLEEVKKEYILEFVNYAIQEMLEDFCTNGYEYFKQCLWDFDMLFKEAYEEQRRGKKGKIHYVSISFLHSSIQSKTYEIQIELYDENFYFDKKPIVSSTTPFLLNKYYEKNWEHYAAYMHKNVIQLKRQELLSFRMDMNYKYKKFVCEYIKSILPYIMRLKSYEVLEKSDDINILYGDYYAESIRLN